MTARARRVEHYWRAGHELLKAKAKVAHGEWLPALKAEHIHERLARRAMQCARDYEDVELAYIAAAMEGGIQRALTTSKSDSESDLPPLTDSKSVSKYALVAAELDALRASLALARTRTADLEQDCAARMADATPAQLKRLEKFKRGQDVIRELKAVLAVEQTQHGRLMKAHKVVIRRLKTLQKMTTTL